MEEALEHKEKKGTAVSDLARKILLTGVGAIFMTEESLRKGLGDLKVPTEAMGGLVDTLRKQKNEVMKLVANELSKFLSKINVHEELQKALSGMQMHLDVKVNFTKKESAEEMINIENVEIDAAPLFEEKPATFSESDYLDQ